MTTNLLFEQLWNDYIVYTPGAKSIHDLFEQHGENVINDHIAYRTVSLPKVEIDVVARAFEAVGYVEKERYVFKGKHLTAKHFDHPDNPNAPKVFISQLELDYFSEGFKYTFRKLIDKIPPNELSPDKLVLAGNIWGKPSYSLYKKLKEESEYGAWFYVFGFRANHFTVSVNHLQKLGSLEEVNKFLKQNGYALNASGGEVKGSKEQYLKQSSTLAAIQPIEFEEGTFDLPTCFYEFAERFEDESGELYGGFITSSADKIFESTDFRK